jgi:hypothetical protein
MPRVTAIATGVVTALCALFGILYNAQSLVVGVSGGFSDLVRQDGMDYFYPAFYSMSAICIVCYLGLFWGGVQLARQRFPGATSLLVYV